MYAFGNDSFVYMVFWVIDNIAQIVGFAREASWRQDGATIQKPVRVRVLVSKGRLLIDGFFNEADDGETAGGNHATPEAVATHRRIK